MYRASLGSIFTLIMVAMLHAPAQAERMAILVGVSQYDLQSIPKLDGPPNDVKLMHDVLRQIGIEDFVILADGVDLDGTLRPTRANIEDALIAAVEGTGKGDQVIVYLSGHGTRQHDLDGDEEDGFDEVFLPADVQLASLNASQQTIPNALVDDRIGEFIDAVRNRGGDVWLIMDSCFSGTGARAANLAMRSRQVLPAALGITRAAPRTSTREGPESRAELGPEAGGFVAFYASQAFEEAKEFNFAYKTGGEPEWYGLFTAKFADRLRMNANVTYRQLYEAVLDDMNDLGLAGIRALQTPYREGTLLDDGIGLAPGVRQYRLDGNVLAAGTIQGVTPGSVLAIVADAVAEETQGLVQVHQAKALASVVRPVASDCALMAGEQLCPVLTGEDAAFLAEGQYARMVAPAVDLVLRLSEPLVLDAPEEAPAEKNALLRRALDDLAALDPDELGVQVELNAPVYDLATALKDGRIWFSDADGFAEGDRPSNLAWPQAAEIGTVSEAERDALATLLRKAAKAHNLIKVAESLRDQRGGTAEGPLLYLEARVRSSDPASLIPPQIKAADPNYSPREECDFAAVYDEERALESSALIKQCDHIQFTVQAQEVATAIDLNRIYIDANFGITVLHQRLSGPEINQNLETMIMCSDCPEPSAGSETVLFISAEAVPNTAPFDLGELSQEGVDPAQVAPKALDLTRGGTSRSASALSKNMARNVLLSFAAPKAQTRGNVPSSIPDTIDVQTFRWRVVPRDAAMAEPISAPEQQ